MLSYRILLTLFAAVVLFGCLACAVPTQREAVAAMAARVLGKSASENIEFTIEPTPNHDRADHFSFVCQNGRLAINATSGTAAGAALHSYMRNYLHSSVTWGANRTGYHIEIPISGFPPAPVTNSFSLGQYRYHMNVCTYGYTMAFWQWEEWEAHLDWMALHGINLPLASEGGEYVWWRTYTEHFNLTSDDVLGYLTGPAFFPWNRMGNIHTWAGPVSIAYLKNRADLQRRLLQRMRDFGMNPILPSFDGHIPGAFKRLFPKAHIIRAKDWLGGGPAYSENYLIDPADPLFEKIADAFMKTLTEEYGTSLYYSADTWNEMTPNSTDLDYIRNSSTAVYKGVTSANPDAVWVMQGWLFVDSALFWTPERIQAYLSGVPPANLLILDLTSEFLPQFHRTNGYFGYNFLWCMLHNYGGRRGIYGNVSLIASQPVIDYAKYPTMVGTGITMEAIDQNELLYELMLDVAWRASPMGTAELQDWMTTYAAARYGSSASTDAIAAFQHMASGNGPMTHFLFCCPHFTSLDLRPWVSSPGNSWDHYDADTVLAALRAVLPDVQRRNLSDTSASAFKYDAIDIARQFLSNFFTDYHRALAPLLDDSNETSRALIGMFSKPMLQMIVDLDRLMLSDQNFLMGLWIESAKKTATSESEKKLFEFNARTQVSTWGPDGHVHDYAGKPWGSLLTNYTLQRWIYFFQSIAANYTQGKPFKFNETIFAGAIYKDVEYPFTLETTPFPTSPTTDTREQILSINGYYATGNSAHAIPKTTYGSPAKVASVAWHSDVHVMFNLCRLLPHCKAFSSNGTLFSTAGPLVKSRFTLYVMPS